ncbi:hypothetical protein [Borrelia sp. RT5S]|nr:hypothetical protein [Borrelia sp. RT5S]UGQ16699.1 hypothetical protein LSO06_05110 [Borrelia sp. RT5S]
MVVREINVLEVMLLIYLLLAVAVGAFVGFGILNVFSLSNMQDEDD